MPGLLLASEVQLSRGLLVRVVTKGLKWCEDLMQHRREYYKHYPTNT